MKYKIDKNNIIVTLNNKQIVIDEFGTIQKEDISKKVELQTTAQFQYIVFRSFLIVNSCKKYIYGQDLSKKHRQSLERTFNSTIAIAKKNISQITDHTTLQQTLKALEDELYELFLEQVQYIKGKRFLKLYPEAIEYLWNLSFSLFAIDLYQHFTIPKNYEYLLNSYRFYFALEYLKKYGFDNDDFQEDYILNNKTILLIAKVFEEKIIKLHKQKKGDFHEYIADEITKIQAMELF